MQEQFYTPANSGKKLEILRVVEGKIGLYRSIFKIEVTAKGFVNMLGIDDRSVGIISSESVWVDFVGVLTFVGQAHDSIDGAAAWLGYSGSAKAP